MVGSLELIKKTTVSTSTTSLDITDVFSAKYDVYKITASKVAQPASSGASSLHLRFINSSSTTISTNYDYAGLQLKSDTSYVEFKSASGTEVHIALGQVDDNISSNGAVGYVFNPFSSSSYTFYSGQSAGVVSNLRSHKVIGVLHQTDSITGINIFTSGDAIDTGIFSVFGVK